MKKTDLKIIIADDHPIVREALKQILESGGMQVVAEAENGNDVLSVLSQENCDMLILDMAMPGSPVGPELVEVIISTMTKPPPIVVFSMSDDGRTASDALQAGASAYLTKDSEPGQIMEAINKVICGGKYISQHIAEKILFGQNSILHESGPREKLSKREYQIFLMLVNGTSIDSIANELYISRQTVGTHKSRLMQKLGLKSNIDIVRYAITHGLIKL